MTDERLCECFGDSGLHASTHRPLRDPDREHCDLCGYPIQPGSTDVLTAINTADQVGEPNKMIEQ